MRNACLIAIGAAWLACAPAAVHAAEGAMGNVLPAACPDGWNLDGKTAFFDKETLFDRINGEAELFFPYGFDVLASARYANPQNPRIAVDADVYRMGSLLDAFGMYANYRGKENLDIKIGAEGALSSSSLMFYQGRYFVRLQATGTTGLGEEIFLACARAISRKIAGDTGRPKELDAFAIPSVVPKSERYIAQSLLGYDFFRRGLIADAVVDGDPLQLFLVPEDTGAAATRAFDRYRSYLETSGKDIRLSGAPGRMSLAAVDPLYGNVFLVQTGRFLAGAARFKDSSAAERLVDRLRSKVGGE
jgi:hypothetical protein